MTKVDIWNAALDIVGGGRDNVRVTTVSDESINAVRCRDNYDRVKMMVLSEPTVEWVEAVRYADLGAAVTAAVEVAEWDYAFLLPTDMARFVKQTDEDDHTASYDCERVRNYLLTNTYSNADGDSAYIKYICDMRDAEGYFGDTLAQAIAIRLAAEIAVPLTGSTNMRAALLQEYLQLALPKAQGVNGAQLYEESEGENTWSEAGR